MPAMPAAHLRFGLLCLLAYVALSWAVRFDMRRGPQSASLVYPLDTFSMYAPLPDQQVSHLLVRDAQGRTYGVTTFAAFECADLDTPEALRCADTHAIAYHRDDLLHYVRSHAGPGDTPVELIARSWRVRRGEPATHVADCVVARCRVSR
jgi:hypothetical protein